jgi:polyhydroxyalkanoate synthase
MAQSGPTLEGEPETTMVLGPLVGLAREDFVGAIAMLLRETASDPQRTFKHARSFSEDVVQIMTGKSELTPNPRDKRFMDPAFTFNPFYKAGMQYFLAVEKGTKTWIDDLGLDAMEKDRASFISQIVIDALSPTNSFAGNPMAQKRAIDSGGLSLIKGLKNAYEDMTKNQGMVSQVNKKPFTLGENVAASPGAVVYRDEMMELVQYQPSTENVYEIPQLTIPPQINKMYINDLSSAGATRPKRWASGAWTNMSMPVSGRSKRFRRSQVRTRSMCPAAVQADRPCPCCSPSLPRKKTTGSTRPP